MRLIPTLVAAAVLTAQVLPIVPVMPARAEIFPESVLARTSQPAKSVPVKAEDNVAFQQLDEDSSASVDMSAPGEVTPKTLQGSITTIRVVKGRSQLIKFAQPIMRISIADPQMADVIPLAPDQIMLNGKLRGVTSLIVWDEKGQEGIFDLYVQNDTTELLDAVATVAPNEKIQARVTDDSFILSGQVSNTVILDEIRKTAAAYGFRDDKFIDLTETPVPQVVLEVKIAETTRSTARELKSGVALGTTPGSRTPDPFGIGRLDSLPPANAPAAPGGAATPAVVNPAVLSNITNAPVGGFIGAWTHQWDSSSLNLRFQALDTKGKINTLANPTLVCTHGREAEFLAGGEFPFVSGTDQNGSPIIQFKDFGVKLKFTPWIAIRSGRVEMHIENEVSSVDRSNCQQSSGGLQVCGLLKRVTKTTVELVDGDSLLISGILQREEQNVMAQTPWIANVPILGNMFKNGLLNKRDSELIVLVTPHIVKPTDYGKYLGASR